MLQGGREVVAEGQIALARTAAGNGVRRILPSDFALDLFKASPGEHPAFDLRREAGEATAAMYGTYQLYMLTGQTALVDLQNDRYPDIEPVTLER